MNPSEILSELSIRIYEPPLSDLWDNGRVADSENPVAVLMLVIGFETEVSMNGFLDFIGNSTGIYAHEIVGALNAIGCKKESKILATILKKATDAGMTYEAIQKDRRKLGSYAVTTFEKTHGNKWHKVSDEIGELEKQIDFEKVFKCAEDFIDKYKQLFMDLLEKGNK